MTRHHPSQAGLLVAGLLLQVGCAVGQVQPSATPVLDQAGLASAIRSYVGHRTVLAREPVTVVVCALPGYPEADQEWAEGLDSGAISIAAVVLAPPCRAESPWQSPVPEWPAVRIHRVRLLADTVWIEAVSGSGPSDRTMETERLHRVGARLEPVSLMIGPTYHDNLSPMPRP